MAMKREDYKAVKHMNKPQMEAYLQTIYNRGYAAGLKAMPVKVPADTQAVLESPAPETPASE